MVAKNQVEKLKGVFEQQRAEILTAINRLEEEARTVTGNDPEDIGDKAVSNFSKEFLFQQLATHRKRLRRLDAALQRMRMGNFGVCSNCGSEIPTKRLEAMPWTEYCRDCQEEIEKRQSTPAGGVV
jgi:DnaK suppressor protein